MGTRLEMLVFGAARVAGTEVWERLRQEADRLDGLLNRFDPKSELSRVNASCDLRNVTVSPDLAGLVRLAFSFCDRSCGLFDISKGGREEILLDEKNRISLMGHELDFGGFAKGFFLKEVKEMLADAGIGTAFVDFGGSSILALGRHPFGDCWKVGVNNPFDGGILAEVELRDEAMSTSGNTPGYSSHIIHPKTGKANEERKLVTVAGADPLEAEVLSTALMIAEPGETAGLEKAFPGMRHRSFRT